MLHALEYQIKSVKYLKIPNPTVSQGLELIS